MEMEVEQDDLPDVDGRTGTETMNLSSVGVKATAVTMDMAPPCSRAKLRPLMESSGDEHSTIGSARRASRNYVHGFPPGMARERKQASEEADETMTGFLGGKNVKLDPEDRMLASQGCYGISECRGIEKDQKAGNDKCGSYGHRE
jgi:hypothetical protein